VKKENKNGRSKNENSMDNFSCVVQRQEKSS
jgi:hypothetical protein